MGKPTSALSEKIRWLAAAIPLSRELMIDMKNTTLWQRNKKKMANIPGLARCKRYVWRTVLRREPQRRSKPVDPELARSLRILKGLEIFYPNSAGSKVDLATSAIHAANQVFPVLRELLLELKVPLGSPTAIEKFAAEDDDLSAAAELKELFDKHGSDKASVQRYHLIYGKILKERGQVRGILEIGLGTCHTDVLSHMGAQGQPGASLRAFREFLPNATVFGADVDRRILFQEERIQTYWVDQTDPAALRALSTRIPAELDLIIDDGLHAPNANLAVITFALKHVKVGGWIVIEDISSRSLPVWEVVMGMIPHSFAVWLFCESQDQLVLVMQRRE
jgi:hypothetical protein